MSAKNSTRLFFVSLLALTFSALGCGGGSLGVAAQQASPAPQRIAFVGDSITFNWGNDATFKPTWSSFGRSGWTCTDLEQVFAADLATARFDAVHILCGTNDLYRYSDLQPTTAALAAMIATAKANGLRVFVGTVPPWGAGPLAHAVDSDYAAHAARIEWLNNWIRSQGGITVVEYNRALSGPDHLYVPAYSDDGVHPTSAGFAVMAGTFPC